MEVIMAKIKEIDDQITELSTEDAAPRDPKNKTKQFKEKKRRGESLTYTIGDYCRLHNIKL